MEQFLKHSCAKYFHKFPWFIWDWQKVHWSGLGRTDRRTQVLGALTSMCLFTLADEELSSWQTECSHCCISHRLCRRDSSFRVIYFLKPFASLFTSFMEGGFEIFKSYLFSCHNLTLCTATYSLHFMDTFSCFLRSRFHFLMTDDCFRNKIIAQKNEGTERHVDGTSACNIFKCTGRLPWPVYQDKKLCLFIFQSSSYVLCLSECCKQVPSVFNC